MKQKKEKVNKREWNKAWKDVKDKGFGIYDTETNRRINPETLSFLWRSTGEVRKIKREVVLHRDLMIIEEIFNKKFGKNCNPYDLELFKKDEGLFLERMIRAVEICTMSYVLNKGGALNKERPSTIIRGKKKFVWED